MDWIALLGNVIATMAGPLLVVSAYWLLTRNSQRD